MKSRKTVRIRDIPLDTTDAAILEFAKKVLSQADGRSPWRSLRRRTADQVEFPLYSSAFQMDMRVATISFSTASQKEKALQLSPKDWTIDDSFLELTILHSPQDVNIDICAIHGLGGNGFDTWMADRKMWLRDLLPSTQPFQCSRIMTYGYNSNPIDGRVRSGIRHWAIDLLNQLGHVRRSTEEKKRPIIFVCHSLGGLVGREAMIRLGTFPELYSGLRLAQCGLLFLSTPHSGTDKANWNGPLLAVAENAFGLRSQEIIDKLRPFNDPSVASKEQFANLSTTPPYFCLCEGLETMVFGKTTLVVTQDSAGLNSVTAITVTDVDHRTICKFDRKTAGYLMIVDRLENLLRTLTSNHVEHKLELHTDQFHRTTRTMWQCVDASTDKRFLADCKACRSGKIYGAYYNAVAHLRRAHFSSRKTLSDQATGSIAMPSVQEFRDYWLVEIEQVVSSLENNPSLGDNSNPEVRITPLLSGQRKASGDATQVRSSMGITTIADHSQVRQPNYYHYPTFRVSYFVTRQHLLDEIARYHQRSTKLVVLLGMGGCGKTQLALEYCEQAQSNERCRAIFWVNASSPKTVAQSYSVIADKISDDRTKAENAGNAEANVKVVLEIMSTWTMPWLLVFDNFDEPKAFDRNPVKNYFPRGRNGFILLTSRHAASQSLGETISVSDLSETEALELLFTWSKCDRTDSSILEGKNVVCRLGYLALALDQAGAYIHARNLDFRLFMDHFNSRRDEVLNATPELWDYRRNINNTDTEQSLSVATTWELSFDQICGDARTRKSKQHLLSLAANFNNQRISEELFRTYYESRPSSWVTLFMRHDVWDKYKFSDVIAELRSLSLIQSMGNDAAGTFFSLHPLIQDWTKLRLSAEDRRKYTIEAMRILSKYIAAQDFDLLSLTAKQMITSHLDTVLEAFDRHREEGFQAEEISTDSVFRFAVFYQQQGRYEEARTLLELALTMSNEWQGPDHLDTIRIAHGLATNLRLHGQCDEAMALHERVLAGREERLGPSHQDTL